MQNLHSFTNLVRYETADNILNQQAKATILLEDQFLH